MKGREPAKAGTRYPQGIQRGTTAGGTSLAQAGLVLFRRWSLLLQPEPSAGDAEGEDGTCLSIPL